MEHFICIKCGAVLTAGEMDSYEEHHPYGDGYASETFSRCPQCGGSDFDEAYECSQCGSYERWDDIILDEHSKYLCKECYDENSTE